MNDIIHSTSPSGSGNDAIESPPPGYDMVVSGEISLRELARLQRCIFITLAREHTLPLSKNVRRPPASGRQRSMGPSIAVFMRYMLDRDYDCNTGTVLTQQSKDLFVGMARWLIHIYEAREEGSLSEQELRTAVLDLRYYIYRPCAEYLIPFDLFAVALIRHLGAVEDHGSYRSCIKDVIRDGGVARLAEKLYFDEHVLIPALSMSGADIAAIFKPIRGNVDIQALLQEKYSLLGDERLGRIRSLWKEYFSNAPTERETLMCDDKFGMSTGPRIPFTLTKKGRKAEKSRLRWNRVKRWIGVVVVTPIFCVLDVII
jgi:hypothetical protein